MTIHIGMLLYPGLTQLDLTGPFEVLHRIPDAKVHLVWKSTGVIKADSGLQLVADTAFAECPQLDVVFVPGGFDKWISWKTESFWISYETRQKQPNTSLRSAPAHCSSARRACSKVTKQRRTGPIKKCCPRSARR